MSTLSATNLKNASSASNNIVLGTDGSTTITTLTGTTITGTSVRGVVTSGTAVASTSGTAIDFTSIPSWVKRVTVMLSGVSTNGTADLVLQLGTGSTPTYTTSGYLGTVATGGGTYAGFSTAFTLNASVAATDVIHCVSTLTNLSGNTWMNQSILTYSNTTGTRYGSGSVVLAATLTAVRVYAGGTNTFDAGSINILYEG